jgi:hypothetical protein
MGEPNVDQLATFLQEKFSGTLRSVVYYEQTSHEIHYVREDVLQQYTANELDDVVEYLRHESMGKEATERRYPHGDLTCEMEIYEDAAEINFILGLGRGVAVGLNAEAFVAQQTFVQKCIEMLELESRITDE